MRKFLHLLICLFTFGFISAQTTYDFTTPATLQAGPPGFSMYKMEADITIGGVAYKITSGANGNLANLSTGGVGNSKCLMKDGSGGDQFNLSRADGQPFQFYGLWLKHQSMNSYAEFMSLPPFYSIYYSTENEENDEYFEDETPMQAGQFTTVATTITKNITVTSVQISFRAMMYYWIDNIIVGPAGGPVAPAISSQPSNKTVCYPAAATFSVTATDASSYQWQMNPGSGFVNIGSGTVYSGTSTSTLTIPATYTFQNGYQYRCVVSGTGSVTSDAATLTVSNLVASSSQYNVACNGSNTGSATINVGGGTAPYSYNWTPGNPVGDGTKTITGLTAGVWTVAVADANGCSLTKNLTIAEFSQIVASTSQVDVSCNGGHNGSATVSASGGAGAFTYAWSPGGGYAATATGLAAGTYTCRITDANNCNITKTFTIVQPAAALPSITLQPENQTADAGGNASFSIVAVNVSGYQWQVNTGAGFSNMSNGSVYSGTTTSTLTITGATAGMNGYLYRCVVASLCSASLTSNIATLTTKSSNAFLSDILVNAGSLSPEFSEESSLYNVEVDPNTGSLDITPKTSDAHATLTINESTPLDGSASIELHPGNNTIIIAVTAEDGETTRTYTVNVLRPYASVASLERASGKYTNGTTTTFTLKFNGEVTGLTADNFSFSTAATLTGYSIESISKTGTGTYNITVNTGEGDGALSLSLANYTNLSAAVSDLPIAAEDGFIVDKTFPDAKTKNVFVTLNANGIASVSAEDANDASADNITDAELLQYEISKTEFTSEDLGLNNISFIVTDQAGNRKEIQSSVIVQKNINGVATLAPVNLVYGETLSLPETAEVEYSDLTKENLAVDWNIESYTGKAGEYVLSGTIAPAKYTTNSEEVSAHITVQVSKRPLHVELTGEVKKTYDGNTTATADAANYQSDKLGVDQIDFTSVAAFEDKNAGTEKAVSASELSISGTDAANYLLANESANANIGTIEPRALEVSLTGAIEKTYDGRKTATLTAANFQSDKLESDDLSFSAWAEYDSKHAGEDKTVTASDFYVGGADAMNYTLTTEIAQLHGSILKRNVTAEANTAPLITKVYDGSVSATTLQSNYALDNVVEGDELNVSGDARYEDRKAGTEKAITIDALVLSGAAKDDYSLTTGSLSTTGDITAKPLDANFKEGATVSKIYDGTTQAAIATNSFDVNGVVAEDDVTLLSPEVGVYDDRHAGEGKKVTVDGLAISGDDANNYILSSPVVDGLVGEIIPKNITVTAAPKTKIYGTTDPAFTYEVSGLVGDEKLSGKLWRDMGKNVGSYVIGLGSVTGGGDYTINEFISARLSITPASLVIKADNKEKKQGTGNPAFTVQYSGLAAGDLPSDLASMPLIVSTATERSPIGYYDIIVSGAASANYNITYATGQLSVIPAAGNVEGSVKAWNSAPGTIEVRIYAATAQDATITLYTEVGQAIVLVQKHLNTGVNTFVLPSHHLSTSTYVLGVWAKKFRTGERIPVKQ